MFRHSHQHLSFRHFLSDLNQPPSAAPPLTLTGVLHGKAHTLDSRGHNHLETISS